MVVVSFVDVSVVAAVFGVIVDSICLFSSSVPGE